MLAWQVSQQHPHAQCDHGVVHLRRVPRHAEVWCGRERTGVLRCPRQRRGDALAGAVYERAESTDHDAERQRGHNRVEDAASSFRIAPQPHERRRSAADERAPQ